MEATVKMEDPNRLLSSSPTKGAAGTEDGVPSDRSLNSAPAESEFLDQVPNLITVNYTDLSNRYGGLAQDQTTMGLQVLHQLDLEVDLETEMEMEVKMEVEMEVEVEWKWIWKWKWKWIWKRKWIWK